MAEKDETQNLEIELTVLRYVEKEQSQKSLSEKIGISVGKTNYIIKALVEKGFVKVEKCYLLKSYAVYKSLTKVNIIENLKGHKKTHFVTF